MLLTGILHGFLWKNTSDINDIKETKCFMQSPYLEILIAKIILDNVSNICYAAGM